MRCDHRYKLVGYRDRPSTPGDSSSAIEPACMMDAVLACLRCARERLIGVDQVAPATVVERVERGSAQAEED